MRCPSAKAQTSELEIVYLAQGEPAPFAGDLFPPERSARLGLRLETCTEKARLGIVHATRLHEIAEQAARQSYRVELDAEAQRREMIERELDAAGAWYRSPLVVAAVTFVGTIALVAGAAYVIGAAP